MRWSTVLSLPPQLVFPAEARSMPYSQLSIEEIAYKRQANPGPLLYNVLRRKLISNLVS